MPEIFNRAFFNISLTFVSIVLVAFTLALVASIIDSADAPLPDEHTSLRARGA